MSKVAVIGAGAFGVTIAIELANKGHSVLLFEKDGEILKGGTANSQNRLHLGLHYPRDLETAIQSKLGFIKFSKRYPLIVRNDFPNYYAIAAKGSRVNSKQFQEFALTAGISLRNLQSELPFGIAAKSIDGIWECDEGVIDIDKFREQLKNELKAQNVEIKKNIEITRIVKESTKWKLQISTGEEIGDFDYIVRATYGNDRIESLDVDLRQTEYEYHRTLILEVSSKCKTKGITIVDGDFLTLLPKGFSDNFLIYAPSLSVLDRHHGLAPKNYWKDSDQDIHEAETALVERLYSWLPKFLINKIESRLMTTRSIQPNVSQTDKRVSEVKWLNSNIVEVWSGKIDHCIEIAEQISSQISGTQISRLAPDLK